MTRLFLLRHAQTADTERFHGSESDIGLSQWGHKQSQIVAERFAGEPIVAVYSSAMRRAIDTARPIAESLNVELKTVPDLHERSMGKLAGADRSKFRHIYDSAMAAWAEGNFDYTHESGESYRMMRERGVPALKGILDQHMAETIVVVSHGMLIRVLISSMVKAWDVSRLAEIKIDNVAVNELTWDGKELFAVNMFRLPEELRNPPEDRAFW